MAKIVRKKKITQFPKILVRLPLEPGRFYRDDVAAKVRERRRGATVYRYLQFREGNRVRSLYLGSVRAANP